MGNRPTKQLITMADFDSANRYHASFSELCIRNGATEDEMDKIIRSLYPGRRADEMIRTFKKRDQRRKHNNSKKNRDQKGNSTPSPEIPIADVAEKATVNDTCIDNPVATSAPSLNPKLRELLDKKADCEQRLYEANAKLAEHVSLRDQYTAQAQSLICQLDDLKKTIDDMTTEVLRLRSDIIVVNGMISDDEGQITTINEEHDEIDKAIAQAQSITIKISSTWEVDIPVTGFANPMENRVSDDEVSKLSASFANDARFENLTLRDLRNMIKLSQSVNILSKDYSTITISFENNLVGLAWAHQH